MRRIAILIILVGVLPGLDVSASVSTTTRTVVLAEHRTVEVVHPKAATATGRVDPMPRAEAAAICRMLEKMRRDDRGAAKVLDREGDGRLSSDQIGHLLGLRGPAFLTTADADRNGSVERSEITSLAEEKPSEVRAGVIGDAVITSRQPANAWVFVGREQSYISDYDVVGTQYQPVVSRLRTGTLLEVQDPSVTIIRSGR